jgi:hypothetical protein
VIRRAWIFAPSEKIQAEHVMGSGRRALLRKGGSPVLPGEEREEEAEGTVGADGVHWQTACFSFSGVFKTYATYGRAGPGSSHPIMS